MKHALEFHTPIVKIQNKLIKLKKKKKIQLNWTDLII